MALPKRADGVMDGTDWDTVIDAIEARSGTGAVGDETLGANRVTRTQTATTLGLGVTTFAVTGEYMQITGDGAGNTVATITGGATGQLLILEFVDALCIITDTNDHTADTVDLSAAFTSADDTILTLIYNGVSWYEGFRSVN